MTTFKKSFLSFFLVFFGFLFCFQNQALAENIQSFKALYKINADGAVDVTETIFYDFGSLQKHGIFRDIPLIKINTAGKKFLINTSLLSLTNENEIPYKYDLKNGPNFYLKIGDPDKLITGLHTYKISYKIKGALAYFSDHDEFYWNVTGNNWPVSVENVEATIILPTTANETNTKAVCFTGATGSTEKNCNIEYFNNEIKITTTKALYTAEGLTISQSFPKGFVATLEPVPYAPFWESAIGKFISGLIILTISLLSLTWYFLYPVFLPIKWFLKGRDPSASSGQVTFSAPVTAWYDPPKDKQNRFLTPVETGTLIDENANNRDLFATIVDLARRGFFKISETKKNDFTFIKQKEFTKSNDLQSFELTLLKGFFNSKHLSEFRLKDHSLILPVQKAKKEVYEKLVTLEFFPENPEKIRTFYYVIIFLAILTGNIFLAIMAAIFGLKMSKRTEYGVTQKNVALSLKNFLKSQERQLEYQADKQLMFERLLPFAIAFGVEKIWANRFKDLTNQPDWYESYDNHDFSAAYLASTLHSSMNSFSSSATPTSSSSGFSSGSGGGGSSGGGGGGGGGGSW